MAHQYSVEIHNFLTSNLKEVTGELEVARENEDAVRISYLEGRLEELNHMRNLLTEKFDLSHRQYY